MAIVKALFLDLGGIVFYDEYVEAFFLYQAFILLNKNGFKTVSIDTFFDQRETLYKYYGNNWIEVFLQELLSKKIGSEIIHVSWSKTLEKISTLLKPYSDANLLLDKLHTKFDLYCLANQPGEAEGVIDRLGYYKFFKKIFIDSNLGLSKPDIRFFQIALKETGLLPNEVIHIGDRMDNDIIPAVSVGIRGIKFTRLLGWASIEGVPQDFLKRFYQSLTRVWHRWEESKNHTCKNVYSSSQLLQFIFAL